MRAVAAGSKALLGVLALSWAMVSIAQPAGTQAVIVPHVAPATVKVPSIRLPQHQDTLASSCIGSAFDVNAVINVDTSASADVKLTAPGVGLIEEFTDETGANIGPFAGKFPTFLIKAFGGGLPPNTPMTITITTYSGSSLSGSVTFVSSLTFDCTTGAVLSAPALGAPNAAAIPTLSLFTLATSSALLVLFGAAALRRTRRIRRRS